MQGRAACSLLRNWQRQHHHHVGDAARQHEQMPDFVRTPGGNKMLLVLGGKERYTERIENATRDERNERDSRNRGQQQRQQHHP